MKSLKDALKAEIAKKKRQLELINGANEGHETESTSRPTKRYIRQGDIEQAEREKYLEEQEERDRIKAEKQMAREEEKKQLASRKMIKRGVEGDDSESRDQEPSYKLKEEDIIRRLRVLGHPIRLFGETDETRYKRLKHLEALQIIQPEGQRNEFMNTMNKLEEELALEALEKEKNSSNSLDDEKKEGDERTSIPNPKTTPIMDTSRSNTKKKKKAEMDETLPMLVKMTDAEPITSKLASENPSKTRLLLSMYFRRLLLEWKSQLEARPDEVKRSSQGMIDSTVHEQTQDYIKPFFDRLKANTMPRDVFDKIVEIAESMQAREYVKANDSYLRLSIGNAPWPIGVTAVGIHERSARERINADQVAHVLNDEVQRKWIQSMKRLMSFCQRKYPPSDPSKAIG